MVPTKRFGYFVAGFTMYAPAAGPTSLPNPPAIPSAENPLAIDLSKEKGVDISGYAGCVLRTLWRQCLSTNVEMHFSYLRILVC